jgi:hypothetical protein
MSTSEGSRQRGGRTVENRWWLGAVRRTGRWWCSGARGDGPFIGDASAPASGQWTDGVASVCARPDDGGWTGGPKRAWTTATHGAASGRARSSRHLGAWAAWGRRGLERRAARTPRRRGAGAGWRGVGQPATVSQYPALNASNSKKNCIEVLQVVNRKVVDLTTIYNFHKGRMVFFSTDFAQTAAKL